MNDLRELYQDMILEHYRSPRNFGSLNEAQKAEGFNPLCGDQLKVYMVLDGGRVNEIAFEGSGCAISTASASLMTEAIKGKSLDEAQSLFEKFHSLVTSDPTTEPKIEGLGKLTVFAGVREFPIRIKCATLAWHAMRAALKNEKTLVTTE